MLSDCVIRAGPFILVGLGNASLTRRPCTFRDGPATPCTYLFLAGDLVSVAVFSFLELLLKLVSLISPVTQQAFLLVLLVLSFGQDAVT